MFLGSFKFATVLAQFRWHEIKPESAIQIRFFANCWNLNCLPSDCPSGSDLLCFRIGRQTRESVFVQRPAARKRPAAHLDVVLLASSKVIEREGIFRRADNPEIALTPSTQSPTRIRPTL